ncbi:NAD-dependent histone deacetylase HST3 [Colletotrichum musicola]|uniref:NAD-dependent histone deacetylase HST3 n=1 Tax=Colletotrichum musicola TaxID=2175873 RepID=A0A8H6NX55_9PEZI|nr:NAD-dependent histone deacetylase HST3 [Colletotrichum musicola]
MPTTQVTPTEDALLQGIADALLKARKIVVITGAGISTNSGIPDFRSENGLYSLIQAQFDAASRDIPTPQCLSTSDSSPSDLEPPPKRRRLSFEDSAICLPSEDSQPTSETWASGDERTWGRERNQSRFTRESSVRTRARPRQLQEVETRIRDTADPAARPAKSYERTPRSSAMHLKAAKRAKSSPPEEIPQRAAGALRLETPTANLRRAESSSPTRNLLRNRGRSASPGRRRRSTANQANPAELRKTSMFRASMQASEEGEAARSVASSPLRPREPWSGKGRDVSCSPFNPPPKQLVPSLDQLTTPRTARSSSPLSPPPSVLSPTPLSYRMSNVSVPPQTRGSSPLSSSPLSSPPAHLFDSFEPRFKSRRQSSSAASTAASSDISDTPNSSNPGKSALPNIKGRDLFDASIWADPLRTSVFYTFATTLRKKVKDVQPTESHHFIGHLRNRGKLVRCYTQNIDQIEEKVGLSTSLQEGPGHRGRFSRRSTGASLVPLGAKNSQATVEGSAPSSQSEEKSKEPAKSEEPAAAGGHLKVGGLGPLETQPRQPERKSNGVECVFLHGSLESLRCFLCGKICPWDEEGRAYETLSGRQPECPYCAGATAARQERGKRALGVGKLRPDIVLYGEEHPNAHLISPIVTHDLGLSPDLLLILGTSLKVHGLKVLVREFAKTIHGRGGKVVFVNFTKPPESSWGDIIDYWVQWDCDAWVSNLKERIPLLWLPPGTKLPKKKKEGGEKPRKRQSTTNEKTKQEASKSSGKPRLSAASNATAPAARSRDSDKRAKPQKSAQSRKSTTVVKPTEPRVRVPASPEEKPQTQNNATPSDRKDPGPGCGLGNNSGGGIDSSSRTGNSPRTNDSPRPRSNLGIGSSPLPNSNFGAGTGPGTQSSLGTDDSPRIVNS